jgi:glycosyltransferase involved in cell wall biosynthesis
MNNKKKIAFLRPKDWPLANRIVEGIIKEQFPDYQVSVIDVFALVLKRVDIVFINLVITMFYYGPEIIARKKKLNLAFWRTPYIFRQIRKLIRGLVKGNDYSFSFQMQSLFDGSTPGIPHFVFTDHTHLENLNYATNNRNSIYSLKWIDLEKEIYQNASLTFVRSSNVRRSVIQDYACPENKVVLAYAGSNAKINTTKTKNNDYTRPHILFVGIDWARKGGPDLVEAFKIVLKKIPTAQLTVVGAKPDLQIPNCTVIGAVPPDELDQYYQQASVFCLPTYIEPFGIVFIEAMTAHLPVVATRVGAIPDFVEEDCNGWLVEPGDVKGIADALIKLLENPQMCRTFGEQSFQLTRQRYSWSAVGEKFRHNISHQLGLPEKL